MLNDYGEREGSLVKLEHVRTILNHHLTHAQGKSCALEGTYALWYIVT